jgi:hypothetical protein
MGVPLFKGGEARVRSARAALTERPPFTPQPKPPT